MRSRIAATRVGGSGGAAVGRVIGESMPLGSRSARASSTRTMPAPVVITRAMAFVVGRAARGRAMTKLPSDAVSAVAERASAALAPAASRVTCTRWAGLLKPPDYLGRALGGGGAIQAVHRLDELLKRGDESRALVGLEGDVLPREVVADLVVAVPNHGVGPDRPGDARLEPGATDVLTPLAEHHLVVEHRGLLGGAPPFRRCCRGEEACRCAADTWTSPRSSARYGDVVETQHLSMRSPLLQIGNTGGDLA